MRKLILAAGIVLALVVPASSAAKPPTRTHAKQYVHAYAAARHRFGAKAVGCNLIGRRGSCHVKATDADVEKSLAVISRLYAPPPTPVDSVAAVSGSYQRTSVSSYVPATTTSAPASGGYCGAYQFDQSTWSSIGMPGSPCGASPGTQDAAALKLHQLRGDAPWPTCGHLWSQGAAAVRQCENGGSYAP